LDPELETELETELEPTPLEALEPEPPEPAAEPEWPPPSAPATAPSVPARAVSAPARALSPPPISVTVSATDGANEIAIPVEVNLEGSGDRVVVQLRLTLTVKLK
jgi:hypothetical protein